MPHTSSITADLTYGHRVLKHIPAEQEVGYTMEKTDLTNKQPHTHPPSQLHTLTTMPPLKKSMYLS